jgi:hypothetical protein
MSGKKKSAISNLIDKLGIDETLTTAPKKEKIFTKVSDIAPPVGGYNYMADLLFLPEDKNGFKYALTMVDLGNGSFDLQELKNKDSASVLEGMKKIFSRKILPKAKASVQTDSGTEFSSVYHKWLYDEDIYHKVTAVARHSQQSNVEALNKQLGRLFNGYMNTKEMQTRHIYKEWTDIIPVVRKELNAIRKRKEKDPFTYIPPLPDFTKDPDFHEGDFVHYKLDTPRNALNQKQSGTFRTGDFKFSLQPKKIVKVFLYAGTVPYRYMLDGMDNVTYTAGQLKKSNQTEERFYIKQIIDKKTEKKIVYYLCWWKEHKKTEATWEPKDQLLEDNCGAYINEYEDSLKKPKKVTKAKVTK